MFSDSSILIAFFLQLLSLFFIAQSFFESIKFIQWNPLLVDEKQISLERKTYLISSFSQMALFLQITSFVLFFSLLNHVFPSQIKGAMCGAGVVMVGQNGEILLLIKSLSPILTLVLLQMNHIDLKIASNPFTPKKFILLFPILILAIIDVYWTYQFINSLTPNLVTNCCSAQSFVSSSDNEAAKYSTLFTNVAVFIFLLTAFLRLLETFFKKKLVGLSVLTTIFFILSALYSLKYFFVQFIYELPAHYCLFDLFLEENHYIGYIIFFGYYGLFFLTIQSVIHFFVRKYFMESSNTKPYFKTNFMTILCLMAAISPIFYWLFWQG